MSEQTVKYTLIYPITIGEGDQKQTISEVSVRRARVKDQRRIANFDDDKDGAEIGFTLIWSQCDLTPEIVDEMRSDDADAIGQIITGFRKSGQATGEA